MSAPKIFELIKKVKKLEEVNAMTLALSEHYTLTSKDLTQLPLNKTLLSVGNKLIKMSDGSIKIGAGVSYVRISGAVYYRSGNQADDLTTSAIYKNSSLMVENTSRVRAGVSSKILITKVISVAEGDIIYLYARNVSRVNQEIGGFDALTFLNVEVVK